MSATVRVHTLFLLCFAAFASLGASHAHACSDTVPDVFSVGNKTADPSCNYGSIQAAVSAAALTTTCAAGTKIILNSSGDYTHQHLTITDKTITLIGRADTPKCNTLQAQCGIFIPCPIGPLRTIDGTSVIPGAVLTIRGNSKVTISHLTITGGNGSNGGGIDYAGSSYGEVDIDNSTITDNRATNGGGINFAPIDEYSTLNIGPNTFVTYNTATSGDGGGIRLDSPVAILNMNALNTSISNNQALAGKGGGIDLVDGTANIGSGGFFGAVINSNTAKYGGGIATQSVHTGPEVNLYTTDPLNPVAIDSNTAYENGGGIYDEGVVCAADFRLTRNVAKEGSGLYVQSGEAEFNTSCPLVNLQGLGSVRCDPSQQCNIVHGNLARDAKQGNVETNGAALRLFGSLYGNNLDVRGNHGGYALHLNGDLDNPLYPNKAELTNCLFAENILTHELMLAYSGTSELHLTNCTLVNDSLGTNHVLSSNDVLLLDDSIIAEGPIVVSSPYGATGDYNLAENTSGLGDTSFAGTPAFIDAANGDYRLFYGLRGGQLVSSPGIDHAPATTKTYDPASTLDIRGQPRDQQVSGPAASGPRDLGAYEMQGVTDRIFIDTFGDDLLLVY